MNSQVWNLLKNCSLVPIQHTTEKVLAKVCKFKILTVDGCDPNLCRNGRLYYEGDGNYSCECTDGFTGINCETSMLISCLYCFLQCLFSYNITKYRPK